MIDSERLGHFGDRQARLIECKDMHLSSKKSKIEFKLKWRMQ